MPYMSASGASTASINISLRADRCATRVGLACNVQSVWHSWRMAGSTTRMHPGHRSASRTGWNPPGQVQGLSLLLGGRAYTNHGMGLRRVTPSAAPGHMHMHMAWPLCMPGQRLLAPRWAGVHESWHGPDTTLPACATACVQHNAGGAELKIRKNLHDRIQRDAAHHALALAAHCSP